MVKAIHDSTDNTLNQLVAEVSKRVKEEYPDVEVFVRDTVKNNGVVRPQLEIRTADYLNKPVPLMRVDDVMEQISNGDCSIAEAADKLYSIFNANKQWIECPEINNETAQRNLYVSIVNRGMNEELLKDVPHMPVASDLALVPRMKVRMLDDESRASFVVNKNFLPIIEMTESEVLETAIRNSSCETYSVRTMEEVMVQDFGMPEEYAREYLAQIPMYVTTNDSKIGGAVGPFISKELRSQIFEKVGCEEGFYLLPSSTEETIAVPASLDVEGLRELVHQVNTTEVEATLVLSDNIYYCNDKLELSMVGDMDISTDILSDTDTVSKGMHL